MARDQPGGDRYRGQHLRRKPVGGVRQWHLDSDADGVSDQAERQLAQSTDPAKRVDNRGVPYNPNVFNTPPISVYAETDQQFVRPGQTLVYTTTVIANAPLAPSILDITTPAALGGSPNPAALPFNPTTFTTAQTVTQQTNLTAQAGLSTQTLAITSSVRARLAPTGPATLGWDPYTLQTLGSVAQTARFITPAASQPGRQDSYFAATMTSDNASRGGTGAILLTGIPGGQTSGVFNNVSPYFAGDGPANIVCNNAGICMVVWDIYRGLPITFGDVTYGSIIQPNGQMNTFTISQVAPGRHTFHPAVASDGTNFLVAYDSAIDGDWDVFRNALSHLILPAKRLNVLEIMPGVVMTVFGLGLAIGLGNLFLMDPQMFGW